MTCPFVSMGTIDLYHIVSIITQTICLERKVEMRCFWSLDIRCCLGSGAAAARIGLCSGTYLS